jgi:hypothetical protein
MRTITTTTKTNTSTNEAIRGIADRALAWIGDQILLTQGHCVDVLLDLLLATDDPSVRDTIEGRLSDIRFMSMVEADELRADLEAVIEISETIESTDLTWAERALECDCDRCLSVRWTFPIDEFAGEDMPVDSTTNPSATSPPNP